LLMSGLSSLTQPSSNGESIQWKPVSSANMETWIHTVGSGVCGWDLDQTFCRKRPAYLLVYLPKPPLLTLSLQTKVLTCALQIHMNLGPRSVWALRAAAPAHAARGVRRPCLQIFSLAC
jgi:hypothetical protein